MNQPLFTIANYGIDLWDLIGLLGTVMFSLRWIVQFIQSARAKKSVISADFWYISAAGSLLILIHFIFGNHDLVGIVSNLFPLLVAGYNIYLIFRVKKEPASL